ncbi:hypothetical protein C2S52_014383 [Perilla frutescens var. hirtella]|nr:hypothetical protein C2S52_014383 [Perilla frutescens var. hirtella]
MTQSYGLSRSIGVKSSSYVRSGGGGELGARSSSHMRSSHSSELTPERTPGYPDFENDPFFKNVCWNNLLTRGCILPVRNQGQTNGCFAFTVITTIYGAAGGQEAGEGSVQELVDFLHLKYPTGRKVTERGLPNNFVNAYNYIKSHGIYSEKEYRWVGQCQPNPNLPTSELKIYIDGFKHIEDRKLIVEQLKKQPLAGVIVVTDRFCKWDSEDKVYDGPTNEEAEEIRKGIAKAQQEGREDHTPYHAVTLVGYGYEGVNEYYLCQNSYGTNWGHHGYFKVLCHVVYNVCYPFTACKKNKNLVKINVTAQDEKKGPIPMDIDALVLPKGSDDMEIDDDIELEAKDDMDIDADAMETE